MLKEKKSFFERLAGSISVEDEDEHIDFTPEQVDDEPKIPGTEKKKSGNLTQKTVSDITYLRRACLSALVGVAADDDDGNEAEGQGQPARPAAPRQTAPVVPTKPGGAPNISR